MTKKNVKRLKTMMDHKDDNSQTQVSRKFIFSQQYVSKTLATKTSMDEESYFTLAHTSINAYDRFFTSDFDTTPESVKYSPTAKFKKKLLVYVCFFEKGISKPYFVPSGVAVNQKVYLEECIKKKSIPFIAKHHSDGEYVFKPDLA